MHRSFKQSPRWPALWALVALGCTSPATPPGAGATDTADASPTAGTDAENALDTDAGDAGDADNNAADTGTADASGASTAFWCGFRYDAKGPLLCESYNTFGGTLAGKPKPQFPFLGKTLTITPGAVQRLQLTTIEGGAFRDVPGTGTRQSSKYFAGLKDVEKFALSDSASFSLEGKGFHAFGSPVSRVAVSAEGVLVFGDASSSVDMPLGRQNQRKG